MANRYLKIPQLALLCGSHMEKLCYKVGISVQKALLPALKVGADTWYLNNKFLFSFKKYGFCFSNQKSTILCVEGGQFFALFYRVHKDNSSHLLIQDAFLKLDSNQMIILPVIMKFLSQRDKI